MIIIHTYTLSHTLSHTLTHERTYRGVDVSGRAKVGVAEHGNHTDDDGLHSLRWRPHLQPTNKIHKAEALVIDVRSEKACKKS